MLEEWVYRRGLRAQMALSYIWVTVLAVVVLQTWGFLINGYTPNRFYLPVIRTGLFVLLVAAPIGGAFGAWATNRLVKRIRTLASATTRFATGDYSQRVQVVREDEVGQLEKQFNLMAAQLVDSIARQQALAEQNARMEERARISRELHDAISQNLFSMRTLVHGLHAAVQGGDSAAQLEPHIALLEQTTDVMAREMRALLLEMRPPQLQGLRFDQALAALADAYASRLGIAVTTAISPVQLGTGAEDALLRISQEALNNAARHSNATLISLELAPRDDMAVLSISDNGQGFDAAEYDQSYGLGLRLMQERASQLGGHFSIDTGVGRGTRIEILISQEKVHDPGSDRR